jgi:hypothetical protein
MLDKKNSILGLNNEEIDNLGINTILQICKANGMAWHTLDSKDLHKPDMSCTCILWYYAAPREE